MFNEYPYTDYHELNTDWIISKIKNVETAEANSKQYAEDADAAKVAAIDAKDIAVAAKDDAVEAKDDAVEAKYDAIAFLTDTKDQLDLLQSRVDNIIPDGTQTAGNTELLDIRVGGDGITYDSAGNAVRGQFDIAENAIKNTVRISAESLTWQVGVIQANGSIAGNAQWNYVEIPVIDCKFVDIYGTFRGLNATSYNHIAFYSGDAPANTSFISGFVFHQSGDTEYYLKRIEVPAGTALICICNLVDNTSTVSIDRSDIDVTYSKVADTYISNTLMNTPGRIVSYAGYSVSDLIEVHDNSYIQFDGNLPGVNASYNSISFYDMYYNLVGSSRDSKAIYSIPADAYYARYIINTANPNDGHYLISHVGSVSNDTMLPYDNLMKNYSDFQYTTQGVTFTKTGNTINIYGTVGTGYPNAQIMCFPVPCVRPGKKYKFIFDNVPNVYFQYMDTFNSWATLQPQSTITIPAGSKEAIIRLLVNPGPSFNDNVNIELAEVSEDVEEITISSASDLYNFMIGFPQSAKYTKLYIEPGTYDLYTGLFENYILSDSMDFNMNDHYLHNVEIIGNNSTLQLHVPEAVNTAHSASVNTVSILNVRGNVFIHDLVLDAENCRYACHDETQSDTDVWYTEHRYKNVTFKYSRSSVGATAGVMQAIGIGGNQGQRYVFENCSFLRTGTGGIGGAFYIHGRAYNIAEVNFDNCIFDSVTTDLLRLSQYTGNDIPTMVNITNSVINGDIISEPQTSTGFNVQQWVVNAFNTYCNSMIVEQSGTFPLVDDPTFVNSIAGTISHSYIAN